MRKYFGTLLIVFILSFPALTPVAIAQDDITQQVETLSAQGAELFRAGEYEEAIVLFEEAYSLDPVPNLLYNIGRCYEQLEDWSSAKDYFEQFITSPDVTSPARRQAMNRVQSLNEIMAAEAQAAQAQVDGDDDDDATDEPSHQIESPSIEASDRPSRLPALASLGAGGALLAGGLTLGLMAQNNAALLTDSSLAYQERLDAQTSARTQAMVADAFYISGALATVAGIYLLLNSRQSQANHHQARMMTPWVDGDGAGVGVHFHF